MECDPQEPLSSQMLSEEELKDTFEMFGVLTKGYLNLKELEGSIRAFGMDSSFEEVRQLISEIKGEISEKISYREFKQVIQIKQSRWDPKNQIEEVFRLLDRDRNGKISVNDLRYGLRELPYSLSDEELMKIIERADSDQDGELSLEEFTRYILSTGLFH